MSGSTLDDHDLTMVIIQRMYEVAEPYGQDITLQESPYTHEVLHRLLIGLKKGNCLIMRPRTIDLDPLCWVQKQNGQLAKKQLQVSSGILRKPKQKKAPFDGQEI